MAAERNQVIFEEWDNYVTQAEGQPLFIAFDAEAARDDLTHTLPHCVRILIPLHAPNHNGAPVEPETQRLLEMEEVLCENLAEQGVSCRLVGQLTHQGMRELVFQLDDWDAFRPVVALWMGANPDYEIDVAEHEGWDFFDEIVRPTPETWLFLADRKVVDGLIAAGSDPAKEHTLEFVFRGEPKRLQHVAEALRAHGYEPLGELDVERGEIVMCQRMPLDPEAIFTESRSHLEMCERCEVEYDGWGAEVVK